MGEESDYNNQMNASETQITTKKWKRKKQITIYKIHENTQTDNHVLCCEHLKLFGSAHFLTGHEVNEVNKPI